MAGWGLQNNERYDAGAPAVDLGKVLMFHGMELTKKLSARKARAMLLVYIYIYIHTYQSGPVHIRARRFVDSIFLDWA